jgi:membrane-associated phospholipid phosphatase
MATRYHTKITNLKSSRRRSEPISPTIQVVLATLLFFVSVLASRGADMVVWETNLFLSIYNWPDFLRPVFLVLTQFGSVYALAALLVLYFIAKRYHIVLRMLLSGLLAYLLAGFAKDMWGRLRPADVLVDVVNRDFMGAGSGFPSAHTALAVALALTIGHYLPRKYRWSVPVLIFGVALSRVYLGVHAPLDLVGGFAIGWFSYALFRHVRLQNVGPLRRSKPIQ